MAPRAYWKGYLRLSLVSCPIQLFPATSEREKVRFHQINKKTGHRIKYCKVDTETGDQVDAGDIVMGYEVGKGKYIEVTEDELEAQRRRWRDGDAELQRQFAEYRASLGVAPGPAKRPDAE